MANRYDQNFKDRFAYHYARVGSVARCVEPLLADFPDYEVFNRNDLNQLHNRIRNELGYCPLTKAREDYMAELEGLNSLPMDNIRSGKKAIDEGLEILINKLNRYNQLLSEAEVGEKIFNSLLFTQKMLTDQISKYSGIESAMKLKEAMAHDLLKKGKGEEATRMLTGMTTTIDDSVPKIMDNNYSEED